MIEVTATVLLTIENMATTLALFHGDMCLISG